MNSEDEALRVELEAARDTVRQEIDRLLGAGASSGGAGELQDLQKELDQLEEALSNLGEG